MMMEKTAAKKERRFDTRMYSIESDEAHIIKTISASKQAFYESQEKERLSYFEFLWLQGRYIKKRWWLLQMAVLVLLWLCMAWNQGEELVHRETAVFIPLFAVILIPELWKNIQNRSVEIENASYFTLRQIYCARLLLFAMVDLVLLSAFFISGNVFWGLTAREILIQFLVPLNLTCGIYLTVLCSRRLNSELLAVGLCLTWTALWYLVISSEWIYRAISLPLWGAVFALSAAYLVFLLFRVISSTKNYCEVELSWN